MGANVLIAIDNTGANDPVDRSNPRTWNFEVLDTTGSIRVNRSLFGLNDGVNTVASIVFTIYSGLGGNRPGNVVLRQATLTADQVDNKYTTMEQFGFSEITFGPGKYSATLTSEANSGNQSYFLKMGKLGLYVDDGTSSPAVNSSTMLSSSLWVQDSNSTGTAVPEPHALLSGLLGGLLMLRRRR